MGCIRITIRGIINNYQYSFGGFFEGFLSGVYTGSIVGFYGIDLIITNTILGTPC